jgi:hypothetical protein
MVGSHVFTEADHVSNRTKPDSVGIGAYNNVCVLWIFGRTSRSMNNIGSRTN